MNYPYIWYWRRCRLAGHNYPLGEYKGLSCRVVVRGRMNNCLIEFKNGKKFVTSRNGIRKIGSDNRKKKVPIK
jgi:hypothetical protein